MHTVELLDEAIAAAIARGFGVRQEWFGGAAAGPCEIKGQRWIFIDLALSPREQLEQVLEGLRELTAPAQSALSPQLESLLDLRKAA